MCNRKVPTAEEVRAQGPIVLVVQQLDPADPSLPRPLGALGKKKKTNLNEKRKLAETRAFGGLLPQRS
jgi:hypothetical protein